MDKYEKEELEFIQKEMEEWNHPDNVAYRNRNGCDFEHEEKPKITLMDIYNGYNYE